MVTTFKKAVKVCDTSVNRFLHPEGNSSTEINLKLTSYVMMPETENQVD